jgi:hypothetical protein
LLLLLLLVVVVVVVLCCATLSDDAYTSTKFSQKGHYAKALQAWLPTDSHARMYQLLILC